MASARIWSRRIRITGGIALSLALVGLTAWLFAINWTPDRDAFPVQGIDISEANDPADWFAVKATHQIQFVYARASMGATGRDKRFPMHWSGLGQAGMRRGAIHVFSLCQLAADQAGNLVGAIPPSPDQLPAALDLAFQPGCTAHPERSVVLSEIARFVRGVESATGKPVILRITPEFEARYHVSSAIPRKLWSVQSFFPPAYFDKRWTLWQASGFRRFSGISGAVNWNVMVK
ncbi:GH25 family lysozyme [Sphingomonas sp. LB-2]|uniref:glycoside hydrolase family 25 protein n=1 Tax=Sphingomonas caeni TaxID=2984949 RepID=UPI00222EE8B6|nr:GH25 family lysozyme [Sphingomonas caeni]MCW3849338.1 GH25 family lysozyme [Sphingomonas caeni]